MLQGERRNLCVFSLSGCRFSGQCPPGPSSSRHPLAKWWLSVIMSTIQTAVTSRVPAKYRLARLALSPLWLWLHRSCLFWTGEHRYLPQELIVMSFSSLFLTIYRSQWGLKRCVFPSAWQLWILPVWGSSFPRWTKAFELLFLLPFSSSHA